LLQTAHNIEVIVSDDSTNNETQNVLLPFEKDSRFKYYRNSTNIGRVANYRKLLFEYATGTWVILLDGDDYYTDLDYVSKALEVIDNNSNIVLVGAGIFINQNESSKSYSYGLSNANFVCAGKDVFTKYLRIPNHQTCLYNRSLAMSLDFYRHPSMGSDSESLYRLCLRGNIGYIAQDVAVWRVHEENTTYNRSLKKQFKEVDFVESIYNDALLFLTPAELIPWKNNMYNFIANHLLHIAIVNKRTTYVWLALLKYYKYFGVKVSLSHLYRYYKN
jgi:glycosyltransferase involved in cell wall biosynthesis